MGFQASHRPLRMKGYCLSIDPPLKVLRTFDNGPLGWQSLATVYLKVFR